MQVKPGSRRRAARRSSVHCRLDKKGTIMLDQVIESAMKNA